MIGTAWRHYSHIIIRELTASGFAVSYTGKRFSVDPLPAAVPANEPALNKLRDANKAQPYNLLPAVIELPGGDRLLAWVRRSALISALTSGDPTSGVFDMMSKELLATYEERMPIGAGLSNKLRPMRWEYVGTRALEEGIIAPMGTEGIFDLKAVAEEVEAGGRLIKFESLSIEPGASQVQLILRTAAPWPLRSEVMPCRRPEVGPEAWAREYGIKPAPELEREGCGRYPGAGC